MRDIPSIHWFAMKSILNSIAYFIPDFVLSFYQYIIFNPKRHIY